MIINSDENKIAESKAKLFHLRKIFFRYTYIIFKYFQAFLSVVSPLKIVIFLLLFSYFLFTGSDQVTDLLVAMLNDWWYINSIEPSTAKYSIIIRDSSFLIALCLWAFTIVFSSRWILLKTEIKTIGLRQDFQSLYKPLQHFQENLLQYAPRILGGLPFAIVAWSFFETFLITDYQHKNIWYWVLVLGSLGTIISGGVITILNHSLVYNRLSSDKRVRVMSKYGEAITSRQAHSISEFPLFRKWITGLAILTLLLTLLLGFLHRIIEWLSGDDRPTTFDMATLVGFGTIFICALCGWGMILMWVRYELHKRSIPFFGFLLVLVVLAYNVGLNIKRRAIRTIDQPFSRLQDVTYVDDWLLKRTHAATDTIPVFIVATEGGGSRSAHWTAGVLARLDDEIPGFRQHLLAISGVSGGSVGASFYVSWLSAYPKNSNIRPALDSLTSADFLSGLVGAFCYPDPIAGFIPFSLPMFDRARWLEDRFSDHFYYQTGKQTLTRGFTQLVSKDYDIPLLLLNSTVVETGKKAIISPVQLSQAFFYDSKDVLGDIKKDIPVKTAMGLSARFPVLTPAGTIYGFGNSKLSYRLVDGGYFENTGIQTAYQLLQLVMQRRQILDQKDSKYQEGRLNNKFFKPTLIFIENGNSRTPEILEAKTGFAPLSAFYKAWDNRTPSTVGDIKYFINKSIAKDCFQQFRLLRPDARIIPLGWYLSNTARDAINEQVKGLVRDTSCINIKNALEGFKRTSNKSEPPNDIITEKINYK